ncbi:MAG: ATP-dependent Clp protease proteolytic subunit [Candidatus Hydrogenedentes bacterium]|nr:ATP-dependent Clp protease proteolytic subunit [Candidatus Hydrogenedentota bacterium]
MNTFRTCLALVLSLSGMALAQDAPAPADAPAGGYVVICPIEDEIDDGVAIVVERAVKEAKDAQALIFVINTPGGRVDSAIKITDHILEAQCPTYAFVTGMGAISAGALISYACDIIVMTPSANMGASTPVMPGAETTAAMDEKSNSFVRAKYRALAEANGHNALIGEAMVDADIELRGYLGDDGKYVIFRVRDGRPAESTKNDLETAKADPIQQVFETLKEELPAAAVEGMEKVFRDAVGKPAPVSAPDGGAPVESPEDPVSTPATVPGEFAAIMERAEIISANGELLTLTSSEARKFGLIPIALESIDAVLQFYSLDKLEKREIIPRWDEALFAFLTSPMIAGLLLMAGLGGIYVEIRTPGFGFPGLVGVTCLAIFFGSHMVIGMAEWVDLLLLAVGVALIAVEVFVLPGFGVIGTLGIASCFAGFYLSLTRVAFPEYSWDFDRIDNALQTMSTTVIVGAFLLLISWRYFPRTRLARSLVNAHEQLAADGYVAPRDMDVHTGMAGVATSFLRPAGRGRFEGRSLDVVTRGEFIESGAPIVIIQIEGSRLVVTAQKETTIR